MDQFDEATLLSLYRIVRQWVIRQYGLGYVQELDAGEDAALKAEWKKRSSDDANQ